MRPLENTIYAREMLRVDKIPNIYRNTLEREVSRNKRKTTNKTKRKIQTVDYYCYYQYHYYCPQKEYREEAD